MFNVSVINRSGYPLPAYETELSAGVDLRACTDGPMTLEPMERALVPTGIYISLPQGTEAQIRPRSGLALKKGITVLNAPGTIDADYRGEVKVLLINLSAQIAVIEPGERIAQMVVAPYIRATFREVTSLDDTVRGTGGFGSTGSK